METKTTTYRVQIIHDDAFEPEGSIATGDDAADAAYVQRFIDGELTAVGVIVDRLIPPCQHCGRGETWEHVDSLWGIGVETDSRELDYLGAFSTVPVSGAAPFILTESEARAIPGYLGDTVREMLS